MQVSVEAPSALERRVTVAVDEARISDAVETRLKDMTKTVKLKGFRPGKVPLNVVKQQYGGQVRDEVVNEVVQSTFYEALDQEKLQPAGAPSFDSSKSEPGQGLEYTAVFEVYPEIKPAAIDKETIEKPVVEIADADVDKMIDRIRRQHVSWEVADRPAKEGDQVKIDFNGTIDGEAFQGGEGKDMSIELGSGRMIKGFEDGIVGAAAGTDLTLDLQFPDEYHAKELAGKAVQFAVHVNTVEEAVLPPIDEDFAKKMGVENGDMAKLREDIKENMDMELNKQIKTQLKQKVMDVLIAANKIEVPKSLIENESEALRNQMAQNLSSQGLAQKDLGAIDASMFAEEAERRVALGLIMTEIVKENGIKVEADNVRAMVDEIARPYEKPEEVVKWYYGDKRRLAEVESLVLEEQVVAWAVSQAKVVEKTSTFDEVMNPEKA
ncbi:MAG: trigger factor [Gammaproteobacteria bacterium]|nr:trigger factor [Gammaproteobacteria bacterium]